jgi:hypothetical protein
MLLYQMYKPIRNEPCEAKHNLLISFDTTYNQAY